MDIRQIEASLHEAIDAGDSDVIERYAGHCAESLAELGDELCIAIISMDRQSWLAVMAVASQKAPKLADALEAIEEHAARERKAFIEASALKISDETEHDALCRADIDRELRKAS